MKRTNTPSKAGKRGTRKGPKAKEDPHGPQVASPDTAPQVVDPLVMNGGNGKMPVRQFVESAILRLRRPGDTGCHVVFSGFNAVFEEYYGVRARAYVDQLATENFIVKVLVKRGPIINLVNAPPAAPAQTMSAQLARVLEGSKT